MSRLKLLLALSASVLLFTSSVSAQDELRFRNGAVLRGKAVEMDASIVVFRTSDGLKSERREFRTSVQFVSSPPLIAPRNCPCQ